MMRTSGAGGWFQGDGYTTCTMCSFSISLLLWLLICEVKPGSPSFRGGCKYQCPGGKCVASSSSICPNNCLQRQRKCSDGSCVSAQEYCAGECKPPQFFECDYGTKCLPYDQLCDGTTNCADTTDEFIDCIFIVPGKPSNKKGSLSPVQKILVAMIVLGLLFVSFAYPLCRPRRERRSSSDRNSPELWPARVGITATVRPRPSSLNSSASGHRPTEPEATNQLPLLPTEGVTDPTARGSIPATGRPRSSSPEWVQHILNSGASGHRLTEPEATNQSPLLPTEGVTDPTTRVSIPATGRPRSSSPEWVQHILDNSASGYRPTEPQATNQSPLLPTEGITDPTAPPPRYSEAVRGSYFPTSPQKDADSDLPSYDAVVHSIPTSGSVESECNLTSTQV